MNYEQAIKIWGKNRIEKYENDPERMKYSRRKPVEIDVNTVNVDFDFNEGYACCGGSDPDCYCSYAESPSANVSIVGIDTKGTNRYHTISFDEFDFATVLEEILEEK